MFTRIPACLLADPQRGVLHQGLRTFHYFHTRLGCCRLKRKLPGGYSSSGTGALHISTAHSNRVLWRDRGQRAARLGNPPLQLNVAGGEPLGFIQALGVAHLNQLFDTHG